MNGTSPAVYSLKRRLLSALLPALFLATLFIVGVGWLAVSHIREHSSFGGVSSQSRISRRSSILNASAFHDFGNRVRLDCYDRAVFPPLLLLTTRFINLGNGRPQIIKIDGRIHEITALYKAYNKYTVNVKSRRIQPFEPNWKREQGEEGGMRV